MCAVSSVTVSRLKHVLTFKSATLRTAHLPYLLPTVALVKDCPACTKIVFMAARTLVVWLIFLNSCMNKYFVLIIESMILNIMAC